MVGRLVVGLGVGASAIVVPAYLAEIAPAKQRGAIVQMYEVGRVGRGAGRMGEIAPASCHAVVPTATRTKHGIHTTTGSPLSLLQSAAPSHCLVTAALPLLLLLTWPQMMLTLGMLSAVLVDALLSATAGPSGWRWMVGLPALPGAAMAASLVLLPESPRWLVLRGRLDAALRVLQHVLAGAGGQQVGLNHMGATYGWWE